MKPRMFIASSADNLDLAFAAQEGLEHDVEPTVWSQGVFAPSKSTMQSLIEQLAISDFGLFILAPSDVTAINGQSKGSVRDNVIFELGLFTGRLGIDRCFMIVPRGVDIRLPTDLLGITSAAFDSERQDGNLAAALGPACNAIRKSVKRIGGLLSASQKGIEELQVQMRDLDQRLTEGLGQIKGSVSDVQSSITSGEIPQAQANSREEMRGHWNRIRDVVENFAADPRIHGQTRARYSRIDRRNYAELISALGADGQLGRKTAKYREAFEIWQRYRTGRRTPTGEDAERMKTLADELGPAEASRR